MSFAQFYTNRYYDQASKIQQTYNTVFKLVTKFVKKKLIIARSQRCNFHLNNKSLSALYMFCLFIQLRLPAIKYELRILPELNDAHNLVRC